MASVKAPSEFWLSPDAPERYLDMHVKPTLQKLLNDAQAKGFTVNNRATCVEIFRKHARTGKVHAGITVYEDGTAIDMTIGDLTVARSIRKDADMRNVLGL